MKQVFIQEMDDECRDGGVVGGGKREVVWIGRAWGVNSYTQIVIV